MMVNLPCLMESCSNFLRPTCSYTECWLSFQTGSCPTGRTTASYSSYLYLILLTSCSYQGTDNQWTLYLAYYSWSCCKCSTTRTPSFSGFFPEPCLISDYSETQQGSGTMLHSVLILCCFCCLFHRVLYLHQHLFRIINRPLCQYRIYYSKQLARNDNQWLHFFQWIICPSRIVYMEFFEFLWMYYRWFCSLEQPVS